ncbi:piggyBac transposable element-derived protein 4-like [Pygocentrus nattereri]|uniref:piggyBac transposable element-derived protein 4-like n=1 Tax=Pygocentrus nattereri TaxID=42514 RepID=UPI001891ECCF|nr:piggyBac transposable element-derived protein 4-like [Pygocentrus nattereri]
MSTPRKRRATTEKLIKEGFSSSYEDSGSGFESGFSDDEEMFFSGMDPVQDDPRLAQHEESETPTEAHSPEAVASESESEEEKQSSQESERWKNVDEDDAEPFPFQFRPNRTPGYLLEHTQEYGPLDLFLLFFSMDVIASLCINTNKNAKVKKQKGKKYKWEPIEIGEFMKFCGMLVFMGVIRCPSIRDYWRTDNVWQTPFVRRIMRRDRFQAISWSLHISDPDKDSENNANKGTAGYDRLMKIRSLMESLKVACKAFYHPKKHLSIDERMVPTKAKNGLKMYIKSKPHKWGYKLFVLCDSANGYTCDFIVCTGKSQFKSPHGLSYDSVVSLLNPSFLGTGYVLYCDSFYTSPTLFRDLYEMKIGACGTVRENRSGYPRTQENSLSRTSERGSMRWIRQGPLLFVKWVDTKEVSICSTIHKAYTGDVVSRRQRQPDGTWKVREFHLPAPIKAYNKYMGGVDLSDQRLQNYTTRRKTYSWYKTFFFHFLDMAVVNAYLLYREQCEVKSRKPMSHLVFRKKLCEELCNAQLNSDPRKTIPMDHEVQRIQGGRRVCRQCKLEGRRSDTSWQCGRCDVPLCGSAPKNCFRKWHLPSPVKAKL